MRETTDPAVAALAANLVDVSDRLTVPHHAELREVVATRANMFGRRDGS
jgi:hypothetical protein